MSTARPIKLPPTFHGEPVKAYLVDAAGKIYTTHALYEPDPAKAVEAMNGEAHIFTGGRLHWTLDNPEDAP
jgi:hypothetical protein